MGHNQESCRTSSHGERALQMSTPVVQVESGLPVPPRRWRRTRWPWSVLEVGENFLAAGMSMATMSSGSTHAGRRLGRRFVCRTEIDGVRVWRIA